MFNDAQLHYSTASLIGSNNYEGWEFTCPLCAYHARYHRLTERGEYSLEIIDAGETQVRHVSAQGEPAGRSDWTIPATHPGGDVDEEAWLTPHIRQQLDLILKKFDY
jgi:hypothetical protein